MVKNIYTIIFFLALTAFPGFVHALEPVYCYANIGPAMDPYQQKVVPTTPVGIGLKLAEFRGVKLSADRFGIGDQTRVSIKVESVDANGDVLERHTVDGVAGSDPLNLSGVESTQDGSVGYQVHCSTSHSF